jgi:hypothetical protein
MVSDRTLSFSSLSFVPPPLFPLLASPHSVVSGERLSSFAKMVLLLFPSHSAAGTSATLASRSFNSNKHQHPYHHNHRDANNALNYRIQYKEYLQSWEEATSLDVPNGQNTMTAALPDLQPCATYCIRIVALGPNNVESLAGPEIIIDTAGNI